MLRTALATLAAAGIACAAAPAAEQLQTIAPGVRVFGARVGGLPLDAARERLRALVDRPLAIVYRGEVITVSPRALGVRARVDRALRTALSAEPRSRVRLRVAYSPAAVSRYVASLARRYDRPARPAEVIGADAHGPIVRPSRVGLAVEQRTLRAAIEQQLVTGARRPLVLLMDAVQPKRTVETLGPVVVIDRAANTLKLYDSTRLVRTFHVATGQSVYPTPSGLWHIVTMQENPWWIPPPSPWAAGAKPVPPGPGNPLGTRWMGLDAAGVGIHGTPDDTSIGYSRSHGCVRMHIPEAEWLFRHVAVGTPVVIL
ncbi:MAG TPA: L,D-transpeptidase family protein [Gaiellaceae bacterium]|nr:L,D-transpeptidase family protein [Gaiellaceae bacterium]